MSEEEAIEYIEQFIGIKKEYKCKPIKVKTLNNTREAIETALNLLEKKDKQIEELKEIDEKRTWTVNNVIAEYIPDYELISLVNRYKDESFIPRVEVGKILNDRKK